MAPVNPPVVGGWRTSARTQAPGPAMVVQSTVPVLLGPAGT